MHQRFAIRILAPHRDFRPMLCPLMAAILAPTFAAEAPTRIAATG